MGRKFRKKFGSVSGIHTDTFSLRIRMSSLRGIPQIAQRLVLEGKPMQTQKRLVNLENALDGTPSPAVQAGLPCPLYYCIVLYQVLNLCDTKQNPKPKLW